MNDCSMDKLLAYPLDILIINPARMYQKCLHSFIVGLFLLCFASVEAQSPSKQAASSNTIDCSSITDKVDQEICMSREAMATIRQQLAEPQIAKANKEYYTSLLNTLHQKVNRLTLLSAEEKERINARHHQHALAMKQMRR